MLIKFHHKVFTLNGTRKEKITVLTSLVVALRRPQFELLFLICLCPEVTVRPYSSLFNTLAPSMEDDVAL